MEPIQVQIEQPGLHYNPLLVTVLPLERRARHPYQLCVMLLLITLAVSQIILGPPRNSSVAALGPDTQSLLNWFCIAAGLAGVMAAVIPERIIRPFRSLAFDATYIRLWEELGSHLFLLFVWAALLITILNSYPFLQGLTVGTAAAFWLGVAAAWRVAQIIATLWRSGTFTRHPSAILGAEQARGK